MIALTIYGSRIGTDGKELIRADIQADASPAVLPKTYEGINGVDDNSSIDAGSRLKVLASSQTYIMGDDFEWYLQNA